MRGFTRETLIALAADIETRWRRGFNLMNGIPMKHPCSSTTDDIECFFSVVRDTVAVADAGFLEGGFCNTIAHENFGATPTFAENHAHFRAF